MKLLISAYACAPNRGSEHGSAWNWALEVAKLGQDATVLVSPTHRSSVLEATRRDGVLQRIRWLFPEVAFWPLQQGGEPVWERTYNLLWQREALRVARTLHREQPFDLVHHLTWGGVRAPTFLGALGAPLVIGPVGGGETSPAGLRDHLPLRGRVLEVVRDLSNATIEYNPIVRQGLRKAGVIFARTADTKNLLSPSLRAKTYVQMELGVATAQIGAPRPVRQLPRKLLYAGRLLYWKGVHIAIEAMARLVVHMPDAQLTIVGNGPEETRLKTEMTQRRLGANITFVSWMPQEQFLRFYDSHDIFVFPSLHDSEGWVVLEFSQQRTAGRLPRSRWTEGHCHPAVGDRRRDGGPEYIGRCGPVGRGTTYAARQSRTACRLIGRGYSQSGRFSAARSGTAPICTGVETPADVIRTPAR